MRTVLLASALAALVACSDQADEAAAQASGAPEPAAAGDPASGQEPADVATAKLSAEDAAALVAATGYAPAADGTVENLCGDRVSPQTMPADVGGAVGLAWLVIVPGGPSAATCYGDVPGDMYLMRREGGAWTQMFSGGGYLNFLSTTGTDGVRDFALGGPGFEFPVFTWDGVAYEPSGRVIDDAEYGRTPSIP